MNSTIVELPNTNVGPTSCPWYKPSSPPKSPWGKDSTPAPSAPVSLADVMSEELAIELHEKEVQASINVFYEDDPGTKIDLPDLAEDGDVTSSDFLLAQALQYEYDREHDMKLKKEEAKLNGQSKVSLSFSNYRAVHPYLDQDDNDSESDDEEYWVDKDKDVVIKFDKRGICGKGKNITTKHDATVCGMKNASKVMNFPPAMDTGDVYGEDMWLSNSVFNRLKRHSMNAEKRRVRLHEKKENATSEHAVDPKTRLLIYKLINADVLESLSGVVSTGKESVIFHAYGGSNKDVPIPIPAECAIKVFKTTLNEFHTRAQYVRGDYRFSKDEFKKKNPRKIIKIWTEKEMINLRKLRRVGIRCPEPIMLRKHLLLMSFVGEDQVPAKKLKDVVMAEEEWELAYKETYNAMKVMYHDARLVHADLSEYNLLYHQGNVWVIDVSQAVDLAHPGAHEFLLRDCKNITEFFTERGVANVPTRYQLFNDITGLKFRGDDKEFLSQVQGYENSEMWMATGNQRKNYQFDYFFNKEENSKKRKFNSKHTRHDSA